MSVQFDAKGGEERMLASRGVVEKTGILYIKRF
jgi:hypothetical protein